MLVIKITASRSQTLADSDYSYLPDSILGFIQLGGDTLGSPQLENSGEVDKGGPRSSMKLFSTTGSKQTQFNTWMTTAAKATSTNRRNSLQGQAPPSEGVRSHLRRCSFFVEYGG